MTVLITGMDGFVGAHLEAHLRGLGQAPVPLELHGEWVDLTDAEKVSHAVHDISPDRVYHLAAAASVSRSFQDAEGIFKVNVLGTRNLLEAVKLHAPSARVLVVSTGEVYGMVKKGHPPLSEDHPPAPANPYAISKLDAEIQCEMFLSQGLDIRRVRPLGHTGPGQSLGFVAPDFASQVAAIKKGRQEPRIKVGNLSTEREFSDVRDVVRAYALIMERGERAGIYNLANNHPVPISRILEKLIEMAQIVAQIEQDRKKIRPSDYSTPQLDSSKVRALGFEYRIPLEKTLRDVLDEWLEKTEAPP